MSTAMDGEEPNWSEYVEDLVHEGKVEEAICHLESLVSKLETLGSSAPELDTVGLSSALSDLAQLYSTKGFSLKADEARSRARDLKIAKDLGQKCGAPSKASPSDGWSQDDGHVRLSSAVSGESLRSAECPDNGDLQKSSELANTSLLGEGLSDDDWEAVADLAPEELLPSQCLPEVSKLSLNEKVTKVQAPKQRGRGTFSYTTHGLYSNQQSDGSVVDPTEREAVCHSSEVDAPTRNLKYGTRHVLVLADFPPSTRTIDLEKLLENFKDHGVVIRWVNDTVALAVFRTPTIALEACSQIKCAFTVRVLDENDTLLSSIPSRDLDPPRQRPQTSARTARRLIAQGMGIKLPTTNFSSKELQQQEVARRNRIVSRQHMRDDAWGDDGN